MGKNGRSGPAVVARWRERLARWRASGLSVAEFSRREGVHPVSLYGWRKRLEVASQRGRGGSRTSQAFLPVEVVADIAGPSASLSASECELVIASLVCRVPRGVDDASLRRLIRILLEEASRC
jgi:transposase-like protein